MLKLGAYINFFIAVGHIICLIWADFFFEFTGVGEIMKRNAQIHPALPQIITLFVAFIFCIFGLYALSAEGKICKLPFLKTGIFFIAAIYITRSILGLLSLWINDGLPEKNQVVFSLCALFIGLLYLLGGRQKWKSKK